MTKLPCPIDRGFQCAFSLAWTLPSGLKVFVENWPDWAVFCEIFLDRPYEGAVKMVALDRPVTVVDLGCNVGYFSTFVADYLLSYGQQDFQLICVDGSLANCNELVRRFQQQDPVLLDKLEDRVLVVPGLVGHRDGEAPFELNFLHTVNRTRPSGDFPKVPYFNLDIAIKPDVTIDLLKLDVEGSEGDFIDTYEDLLRRTKVLVLEFHSTEVDVLHYRGVLRDYGFVLHEGYEVGNVSTDTYINKAFQKNNFVEHGA